MEEACNMSQMNAIVCSITKPMQTRGISYVKMPKLTDPVEQKLGFLQAH